MTNTNVKNLSVGEVICKERNFLDEITIILNSVSSNLQGLFSDFASIPTFACLNSELETLQHETQNLRVNIKCLISTQLQGTQKAMSELHKELVFVRSKYNNLQNEWDKQQEHLGKMQTELFQIRKQLEQQCQFCSSLGAVMGNLVWKASRIPPVVDMLLAGNKVTEFLSIVNGSLVSFMQTYSNAVPNQCADESQFIMSFCGIVTNIAAAPAGRQFIASNPVGKDLIEQMIRVLPLVPTPSGNCLKRLLLMALYNLSINQNGLKFLQQQKSLPAAIAHDLQTDSTFELKLMSLRLLHCLTYDIPSCTVLNNILIENKVTEFLSIVNGSLVSFMQTYSNAVPNQCADESQFIMSFCGIVTNIAAAPAGRQFIASNPVGKDLIEQMIRVLPLVPTPSGNCLKRLLLMALYNLSINQNGLKFLQQQKSLPAAIAHDLQTDSTFELKLMSLRLLHCLTYDIPSCTVLNNILIEVPIEVIQPLSKSSEPEMRDVVKDILENINHARKKFEKTPSSEIKNKSGYDESVKTASGGQNCQAARHVPTFQHPAQCKPINKCLQKL